MLEGSAEYGLAEIPLPDHGDIAIVVGPEGGVSDEEIAALREHGARTVRLGPSVLRASTAAAVALGALGAFGMFRAFVRGYTVRLFVRSFGGIQYVRTCVR